MADISEDVLITRINGSERRGGWQLDFRALQDSDLVAENQRVDLSWRGAFGGGPGVQRSAFTGYVLPSRFEFDRATSQSTFIAQTSDGYLRRGWVQGLGLADLDTTARANYHQWDSVTGAGERLTMGRIVRHILGHYDTLGVPPATNPDWIAHTNMVFHPAENPHGWISLDNVEVTPFADPGNLDGTMRVDRYNVRETDNLWSRLREIANNEFFVIYFDKTDTLYYTKHPMYLTTLPNPVMTFDEDFVVVPPTVIPRASDQVRQVVLHAVEDGGDTLRSEFPTSPTFVYGKIEEISRIRCNAQATLDDWAERLYLFKNRDYTVRWTAPGFCGLLFEILDRIQITYTGTSENGVHIDWNEKKFWIHEISVTVGEGFTGTSEFLLEAENT